VREVTTAGLAAIAAIHDHAYLTLHFRPSALLSFLRTWLRWSIPHRLCTTRRCTKSSLKALKFAIHLLHTPSQLRTHCSVVPFRDQISHTVS
jgi:hypothetical protein